MIDTRVKESYAELVLRMGVNLQRGQPLLINAPIEGATFTRIVVRKAYELGAKDVYVNWTDDELTLLKYQHAPNEVLSNVPKWRVLLHESFAKDDGAVISIHATDPDLLKNIDPKRVSMANKASAEAMAEFQQYIMNDKITWTVISIPTAAWAKKIFPDKSEDEAIKRLWKEIVRINRLDHIDPIEAWREHNTILERAKNVLNKKQYTKLIFKSPGTHLEVGLPKGHIWHGGSAVSEKGIEFNPNMPTEEVFTAPHKYNVHGTVASTKPLNYGGTLIDKFSLTFEDGKVVDFSAQIGEKALKHLLDTDEGACRLGEVALVPNESPISKSGLIFYNTLFDENASCHIALGKAYPTNLQDGETMSKNQLDEFGINDSLTHVDFMIGSKDLNIDGVRANGDVEPVFRKGTWALNIKS